MKKIEMIQKLYDEGFDVPEMKWGKLQKYYKEKMEEVKNRGSLSSPTNDSVDADIERKIEQMPDLRTPLQKTRDELFPKIVDVMSRLKGRSNATHGELVEMFALYNAFYLRTDNIDCGACVSRVYKAFSKMCKGRI